MIALVLIVLPNIAGWLSMRKLNRRSDPAFRFHLLYTRPVRTAVLVGVPMAYLAALPAALVPRVGASPEGRPPAIRSRCCPSPRGSRPSTWSTPPANWSTRNRVVQWLGNMTVGVAWISLAGHRLTAEEIPGWDWPPNRWPTIFDFPLTDYALMALIGLASFGVAVAGVARQRHGDAPAAIPWTAGTAGFPDWLVNLFRFPCPTSSATRAQVWFDLKSSGLPVLTIGVVLAMVIPLLFAVSVSASSPPAPVVADVVAMFSVLAVLILGGNAFGIRARQGRLYASAFEATQPCGTARLAGLKVLVRSVCVLAALVAVGVSVWTSMSFDRGRRGRRASAGLRAAAQLAACDRERRRSADRVTQQVALAVVAVIGVTVMVASRAAFAALAARYPRRLGIAGWLLLLHGVVLVPLVLTGYRGVGSVFVWEFLLDALVWVTRWIDAPAIVLATVYLSWRAFAERLLTLRAACGAILVSAAFGAAWVTMLRAAGVQLVDDADDGCRLDAVAGAAAADGQRAGALVAQPRSPYIELSSCVVEK